MSTAAHHRNILTLYAVRFLYWMHFSSAVLVPFLRDWGGVSYSGIFFLNSWFMVWNFLLEVPTGTIADFFGRRVSLTVGSFVASAGALTYASAPSFTTFLCGEVLLATSMTLMSGADEALAYDSLKAGGDEGMAPRILSRMESWKLAGIVSGALAGGWIASAGGLRAPMMAQAVPSLLAGMLAFTLVEYGGSSAARTRTAYSALLRGGFRYFRGHAQLRQLALDLVSIAALTWMVIWLYQPALERSGVGREWFGPVHACLCLAQIAVLSRIGTLQGLVGGRRRYLRAAAAAAGAGFIVAGTSTLAIVTIPALLIAAGIGLSRTPLLSAEMNAHIPSEQRATVLSVVSMLRTVCIATMNFAVGAIAERSIAGALIAVGATLLVLSAILPHPED